MPRWARLTSPGRTRNPPPTSAGIEALWCGARKGRLREIFPPSSAPATDPTALFIALMVAWRAHEESKTKGRRVAEAWAEKRRKVRAGEAQKLTTKAPAWLRWSTDGWTFAAPHHETVQRIFALTLGGMGEHKIAHTLNFEGVPTMGRAKFWHRSTVCKVLRNPATIGTLTPARIDYGTGKRERVFEDPIPNA